MTTPAAPPPPPYPDRSPGRDGEQAPSAPVRTPGLGDAVASEWTKIRSVRSTVWTLGVMVLLLLGVGLLTAVAIRAADADLQDEPVLSLGFFGVLLGSICVITLGVLTIASEYGTGLIRTTLAVCPSRSRVLIAKSIVFFLLSFTVTTVTAGVVGVLQTAILDGGTPTAGEWLGATVGVGLYVALLGLLALALGAVVRHSAGAITIMIGVVLLPLVLAMFMFTDTLDSVRQVLFEYSIPSQLASLYDTPITLSGPSGWDSVLILTCVTAVAMGAALASQDRRDV
ncbi:MULTISPECIES: ABC transporter permease subunit [unclassified Streptomyces]|uniref:ABC transporter permease subunit n=1 Tax=Streptomyces TaxID=1883 RepID=UPI0001C1CF81|nr:MULTISPECIES: ABC transporter permease subunit [unclassified Streptomyces]AEN12411.1 putative ABC transporter permease protein [Streptomyces sp. SirexAA-E]MYR69802.1 ABC transporter permease subunit [Streptomyces sp. SID4939]MYR99963.1 ABC transporter permease subunit [Streptomyces sp. SID4940]MYT63048.1 ABC transporter permease subunit [Streptomyces sp. SID8357]MYT88676.1 ABC transporter permease subunit [Streptomyces sp. SID8360]